MPKWAEI